MTMKTHHICWLLSAMPALLAASGCVTGKSLDFRFTGVTQAHEPFKLVLYTKSLLGADRLWGLGVSRTLELWSESLGDADGKQTSRDLIREDVLDKLDFVVRAEGNRLWLVDPQTETVLAAVDLDEAVCYPEWVDQPPWALPTAGTEVRNTVAAFLRRGREGRDE